VKNYVFKQQNLTKPHLLDIILLEWLPQHLVSLTFYQPFKMTFMPGLTLASLNQAPTSLSDFKLDPTL
jgi:hypothetical protein